MAIANNIHRQQYLTRPPGFPPLLSQALAAKPSGVASWSTNPGISPGSLARQNLTRTFNRIQASPRWILGVIHAISSRLSPCVLRVVTRNRTQAN